MRSYRQMSKRLPFVLLLIMALMVAMACGDEDSDEVADEIEGDSASSASPTSVAGVDEDVEEVEITIENGEFSVEQIEFQEESPSVIQVTNNDDERYVLMIGDLVAEGWPIAPNQATTVEFTTPVADQYEAELLPEGGDGEALDTMTVVVQDPGGVSVD